MVLSFVLLGNGLYLSFVGYLFYEFLLVQVLTSILEIAAELEESVPNSLLCQKEGWSADQITVDSELPSCQHILRIVQGGLQDVGLRKKCEWLEGLGGDLQGDLEWWQGERGTEVCPETGAHRSSTHKVCWCRAT